MKGFLLKYSMPRSTRLIKTLVRCFNWFKGLFNICYIFITMIIFLRVKWLQRLMMKPKDELCSIFWIVLVDLTGKFGHPSSNHHHVVDHIWNDNGQNYDDVGGVSSYSSWLLWWNCDNGRFNSIHHHFSMVSNRYYLFL